MIRFLRRICGGRIRWVVGLCLAGAFCVQCGLLASKAGEPQKVLSWGASVAKATPSPALTENPTDPKVLLEQLARTDPLELLHKAQANYTKTIHDYTCTFRKKENLHGQMTGIQGAQVKFRAKNNSVYMHWNENPDKARRAIYVEGKWTKKGKLAVLCQPEGPIARALVPSLLMPIHGAEAQAASRRSIDQFGFAKGLELITKYSEMAKQRGELGLTYIGKGTVGDRPTFVFERVLPYTGEKGEYPDRVLVYHLDQEYLIPLMCASYADDDKTELLGKYEYTNVELNVGLTDADFDGKTYKM